MTEYQEHKRYDLFEKDHWWFKSRREFISRILKRFSLQKETVIEFGCGTGYNLETIFHEYERKIGVDLNENAIEISREKGLEVYLSDLQAFNSIKNVDLVAFLDVLYHDSLNPELAIKQANKCLKIGGHIVVFDGAFDFLHGRQSKTVKSGRRFTRNSLANVLIGCGFKIEYANYWGLTLFFLLLIKRKLLDKFFKADDDISMMCNSFFNILMKFENCISSMIRIPFGASIIIVASKIK